LYIDGLLAALSKAVVGYFIGDNFVGALTSSIDDIRGQYYAPCPVSALRIMRAICDDNATEYIISFNASKSKCLVVLSSYRRFFARLF